MNVDLERLRWAAANEAPSSPMSSALNALRASGRLRRRTRTAWRWSPIRTDSSAMVLLGRVVGGRRHHPLGGLGQLTLVEPREHHS